MIDTKTMVEPACAKGLLFYDIKPFNDGSGIDKIKAIGKWDKILNSKELDIFSITYSGALRTVYPVDQYIARNSRAPIFSLLPPIWHRAKVIEKPALTEIVSLFFDRLGSEIIFRPEESEKLGNCFLRSGFTQNYINE